ncbi:MAG: hypothetical protein ACI9KE_002340 [Polyangiales bacterium]|jgi:hypothetical protein
MPRGGRSHVTLASSSGLSKSLLSRSQSRSELRERANVIPNVDIVEPENEKRRRLIVGALIAIAAAVFLLFAVPSDLETNAGAGSNAEPAGLTAVQPEVPAPRVELVEPTAIVEPTEVVEAPQVETQVVPTAAAAASENRVVNTPPNTMARWGRGAPRAQQSPMRPDMDTRVPDTERSVRTRGDSQPEQVGGVLLDTGGEDDTRLRPRTRSQGAVRAGGTLLAE